MRLPYALLLAALLSAPGCGGDARIVVRGQLSRGGEPYHRPEEQVFVTLVPQGQGPEELPLVYSASVESGGRFRIAGPDGRGVPAGKYRVAVSITPLADPSKPLDLGFIRRVNEVYDWRRSPLFIEVDRDRDELTIDLRE